MQQSKDQIQPVMISLSKGKEVVLKIFGESEHVNADTLAYYLKELKKLPPLQTIYAHALKLGVGTEENLIVMTKKEEDHPYVYKGVGKINEMCSHTFHKPSVNPLISPGQKNYTVVEYIN